MPPTVAENKTIAPTTDAQRLLNDVVIKIATKNGSGSQSANLILLRAIFGMGIPVSGKNLFPSNIAGLPTWFSVRANERGWLARRERSDIFIAMNDATVEDDLANLDAGATVILNDALKGHVRREDLDVIEVPFSTLVKEACPDTRLRKRVINVIYVGVVAWLLDIEMDEIARAIDRQFGGKTKVLSINKDAATVGYEWARKSIERHAKLGLQRTANGDGKIILEGNEAIALGLLFGGATVLAWYPITPSSSVCENLIEYFGKYRIDPETGRATFAVVQAEDEIASIGVVLGAGWAGARAVTATSGPGLSLMSEMAGLAYFAEVPAVVVDVQRMGPSTGLPTRTSQGDIATAYQLSHGDTRHVLLIPGLMTECYEFALMALDLAEQLQTLILVMSDLDLGLNKWMTEPFNPPPEGPLPRGKVLSEADLDRMDHFERYEDVDADGIAYRTLPGTDHPMSSYFTRGTGHKPNAEYSENAQNWQDNMDRLARKTETARGLVPPPVVEETRGARIGLVAYGSSDAAVQEARHILSEERAIATSYLRIRALPAHASIGDFIDRHEIIYLIEQNRDAQMAGILKIEFPDFAHKIRSILHYDGLSLDAATILKRLASEGA